MPSAKINPAISVLFEDSQPESDWTDFILWDLAQLWIKQGRNVHFAHACNAPVDADLTFLQIDMSVLSDRYRDIAQRGLQVANSAVVDIRKKQISKHVVLPDDGYSGPVIVKTNLNSGGHAEHKWHQRQSAAHRLGHRMVDLSKGLSRLIRTASTDRLSYARRVAPMKYQVFNRVSDLPRGVFNNPDLVVEKFLPEVEGGFYYVRNYFFLGDAEITSRYRSDHPIVKGHNGSAYEIIDVDPAIRKLRNELGFDFGKFDYTIHDGEIVLFDANPTPKYAPGIDTPEVRFELSSVLAKGLTHWFPDLNPN